jgi:hypothetical protein
MRGNGMYGRVSPMITTSRPAPVVVTYDKKVTHGKNVIYGKRRTDNTSPRLSQGRVAVNGFDWAGQTELR